MFVQCLRSLCAVFAQYLRTATLEQTLKNRMFAYVCACLSMFAQVPENISARGRGPYMSRDQPMAHASPRAPADLAPRAPADASPRAPGPGRDVGRRRRSRARVSPALASPPSPALASPAAPHCVKHCANTINLRKQGFQAQTCTNMRKEMYRSANLRKHAQICANLRK